MRMAGTVGNIVIGGATVEIPDATDLGYIKDGLHLSKEEEVYYVTGVEGLPTPPVAHRTSIQYSMSGTLVEPTLLNIALVFGCTDNTTPMSMGLAAEMDIVTNLEKQVVFNTYSSGALGARAIVAAKAVSDGPGEMVFSDAEEVSMPFTFKVLWDTTGSGQSIIITDA
jgi:hypothetical protein